MTQRTIVVQKTRVMIANEIADAINAEEWERAQLRRLGVASLRRLAVLAIPSWSETVSVAS